MREEVPTTEAVDAVDVGGFRYSQKRFCDGMVGYEDEFPPFPVSVVT
jgi:hypothetical protein